MPFYGRFAATDIVSRLIALGTYRLHSLLLTTAAAEAMAGVLPRVPAHVPVYVTSHEVMNGVVGFNIHRGCLALAGRPGVAEVVVVGVPDEQWGELVTAVVVPASDGPAPDLAQLRADLPGHQRPRRLVVLDALPMSGPGKPDRTAVRRIAIDRLGGPEQPVR